MLISNNRLIDFLNFMYSRIVNAVMAIMLVSCSSADLAKDDLNINWNQILSLQETNELTISIDNETNRFGNQMSYSNLSKSLCLYNSINNSLYFYSIPEGQLIRKTALQRDGENSIVRINALYFYNQDSIFTYNQYNRVLTILNDSGKVVLKKELLSSNEPGMPFEPSLSYRKGKIYFVIKGYKGSLEDYENKALLIYDLKNESKRFTIDTPVEFQGNWADRTIVRHGELLNDDKYIVSWGMGAKMIVEDLSNQQAKEILYKSEKLHYAKEYTEDNRNQEAKLLYQRTNSWNIDLYFDSYRGLLLRSTNVGMKIPKGETFTDRHYPSKNNDSVYDLIEIFDSDLTKVGQVNSVSFYGEIFSTSEGIFITDYQFEPQNEDIIRFKIYEVVEK